MTSGTGNQDEIEVHRRHLGSLFEAKRGLTADFKYLPGPFLARRVQQRTPVRERLYFNTDP
jgi:hypothetical protein